MSRDLFMTRLVETPTNDRPSFCEEKDDTWSGMWVRRIVFVMCNVYVVEEWKCACVCTYSVRQASNAMLLNEI